MESKAKALIKYLSTDKGISLADLAEASVGSLRTLYSRMGDIGEFKVKELLAMSGALRLNSQEEAQFIEKIIKEAK